MENKSWRKLLLNRMFKEILFHNPLLEKYFINDNSSSNELTYIKSSHSFDSILDNTRTVLRSTNDACFENDSFSSDLTIKLSNGEVKAHKFVFVCGSPYFRCMLDSGFSEKDSRIVNLPDISIEDMAIVIQYLYTGVAAINSECFMTVLSLADYFEIQSLIQLCCSYAEKNISIQHCFPIMITTDAIQKKDLYLFALSYAVDNAMELLREESCVIKNAPVSVLNDFIKHPFLKRNLIILDLIVDAIKIWADEEEKRYEYITSILSTFEIAALLHKYPDVSQLLQYSDEKEIEDNWDSYIITNYYLASKQIAIVFGGEVCGHLTHGAEFYDGNSWSYRYSLPDTMSALKFKNKRIEEQMLEVITPAENSGEDNLYNVKNDALKVHLNEYLASKKCTIQTTGLELQSYRQFVPVNIDSCFSSFKGRKFTAISLLQRTNSFMVVGGMDKDMYLPTVQEFSLTSSSYRSWPPLPTPTGGGGAAVINDVLYYVGGSTEKGLTGVLWSLQLKGPKVHIWTALSPLPFPITYLAVAVLHGSLFVSGGCSSLKSGSPQICHNICWKYEPATNEWLEIAKLEQSRAEHCLVAVKGHLYAMGGKNGAHNLSSVEKYHPFLDQWSKVEDMIRPRCLFGACGLNDHILVTGGFSYTGATNSVERYNVNTNTWHSLRSLRTNRINCVTTALTVPCWSKEKEEEFVDIR